MPSEIVRYKDSPSQSVVFTSSEGTTGGFALSAFAGAMIHVTGITGGATTLTWKVRETGESATTFTLASALDVAKTTTVSAVNRAYDIPDEAYAAAYVLATTNAGTVTCRVIVKA